MGHRRCRNTTLPRSPIGVARNHVASPLPASSLSSDCPFSPSSDHALDGSFDKNMAYEACTLNLEGLQSNFAVDFIYLDEAWRSLDEEWTGLDSAENPDQSFEDEGVAHSLEQDISQSNLEHGYSTYSPDVNLVEDSSMSKSEPLVDGCDEFGSDSEFND
jgi:hypothetical protein